MWKAGLAGAASPVGVLLTAGIIGCAASAGAARFAKIKPGGNRMGAMPALGPVPPVTRSPRLTAPTEIGIPRRRQLSPLGE